MKQDLINSALAVLRERRFQAENEYKKKMSPLYADKRFSQINSAYTKISIENARKEANGLKKFDKTEENLRKELEELKIEYNLQNLKPNYSCPKCKDTGYINGEMCSCLKAEISKILLAGSGFEKLESFEQSKKTSGELSKYYDIMQKWCASDFKKDLVLLSGPTGVGKTHLIRCMAQDLIERAKVVKIVTAFHANQDFREFSKTQNEEIIQKYLDCEILFIDDLGTEPLYKNVTVEYFYLILNERRMRKLPTIITTNLDLADIQERYDERIFSRIADRENSITLLLNGKDRRIKN